MTPSLQPVPAPNAHPNGFVRAREIGHAPTANSPAGITTFVKRRRSWWARVGSNHRPTGYEPGALTTELQALTPQCAEAAFGVQGPGGVQRSGFKGGRGRWSSAPKVQSSRGTGPVEFSAQGSEFKGDGAAKSHEPGASYSSSDSSSRRPGPGPTVPSGKSRARWDEVPGAVRAAAGRGPPEDRRRRRPRGRGRQIPRCAAQSGATQKRAHATRRTGHAWQRSHHHGR